MRRPVLLTLLSTAGFALACATLAFGTALVFPFASFVSRDVLIQLPVPMALLVLASGAVVGERFGLRTQLPRSSEIAAAHLALGCLLFAGYACFALRFWPAFAENRFDVGFDLRSGGRWVVGTWLVHFFAALGIALALGRSSSSSPSRGPRIALAAIAIVTCVVALVAGTRARAKPSGYLATLAPVTLDANGPGHEQVGSLCIWRGEQPNGISVAQIAHGGTCPNEPMPNATRRDAGTKLLFDAKRDVFFEPSKFHGEGSGYVSQITGAGHEVVTLREVGAPPPRIFLYCAIAALLLTLALEIERHRGRTLRSSNVAIVGAFAMPLLISAIVGIGVYS